MEHVEEEGNDLDHDSLLSDQRLSHRYARLEFHPRKEKRQ
jgi:hypothetical protein